jgi:flagellar biosynthesis/type III secretory pathway chaperone
MQSKQIEELKEQTKTLFKVVDKLEQRIATLEKVLQSHAKCIGEMREDNPFLLREDEDE